MTCSPSRPTARAEHVANISIVPDAAHVTARRYPEAMEKVRELARASGVDGGSLLITRTIRESRLTALVTARPMIPSHLLPPPPPHTHMECPMEQPIEFLIRAGQADTVDQLREYAVHRLSMSLRRFERRNRHITVRIADVNGPRRGVDSRCSMSVDLVDGNMSSSTRSPRGRSQRSARRPAV